MFIPNDKIRLWLKQKRQTKMFAKFCDITQDNLLRRMRSLKMGDNLSEQFLIFILRQYTGELVPPARKPRTKRQCGWQTAKSDLMADIERITGAEVV